MNIEELKKEINKKKLNRDQFFFYVCELKESGKISDFLLGDRLSLIIHLSNERQFYTFY